MGILWVHSGTILTVRRQMISQQRYPQYLGEGVKGMGEKEQPLLLMGAGPHE